MPIEPKVILIHGFLGHPWSMGLLEWRLRGAGRVTEQFGYSSWRASIESIAERLVRRLRRESTAVDVVTHSMGALVLRAALEDVPHAVRRAVMLAPPHHGSPAATRLGRTLRRLFPALAEMSGRPGGYLDTLPTTLPCEFATLAAERDHVVPERSTRLRGEAAHSVVPGRHGSLPFQRDVAELTATFLAYGRFVTTTDAVADWIPCLDSTGGTR